MDERRKFKLITILSSEMNFLQKMRERDTYEADKEGLVIGSPLAIASPLGLGFTVAVVAGGAIIELELIVEFKRMKVPA